MKRGIVFLVFLLLVITSVSAQTSSYSKQEAINWLFNETKGDEETEEISMALLALNSNGFRIDNPLTVFLQKNLDSPCFPKGSCSIKSTAFALFGLGNLNQNTEEIEKWLESDIRNSEVGKWLIQVTTSSQGSCDIRSGETEINVELNENGEFILNGNNLGSWLDVERDLKIIEKSEEVSVSCPTLGSNAIISLIRQKASNEFIISKEISGNSGTFRIDNSCYGSGNCDAESSFYAAWALNSLNKDVKVLPYLEDNAFDNLIYNSILYEITNKEKYAAKVANLQGVNGDFGNNIFTTSLAVNTLKGNFNYQENTTKAVVWLQSRQERNNAALNGSIGGTKFFTGSALYLALTGGIVIAPSDTSGGYCGDKVVDLDLGEQCDSDIDTKAEGAEKDCENRCDVLTCQCNEVQCTSDLQCNTPREYCDTSTSQCEENADIVSCKRNEDCKEDERCDIVSGGYCVKRDDKKVEDEGCKSDSDCPGLDQVCNVDTGVCEEKEEKPVTRDVCGDGLCTAEEDTNTCPEDCKEREEGLPVWVWVLIFIAGLLILAYIIYAKFVNKTPKKSRKSPLSYNKEDKRRETQNEYYRPLERDHKDEALERELDRSIKEAQDLLKRK